MLEHCFNCLSARVNSNSNLNSFGLVWFELELEKRKENRKPNPDPNPPQPRKEKNENRPRKPIQPSPTPLFPVARLAHPAQHLSHPRLAQPHLHQLPSWPAWRVAAQLPSLPGPLSPAAHLFSSAQPQRSAPLLAQRRTRPAHSARDPAQPSLFLSPHGQPILLFRPSKPAPSLSAWAQHRFSPAQRPGLPRVPFGPNQRACPAQASPASRIPRGPTANTPRSACLLSLTSPTHRSGPSHPRRPAAL